MKRFYEWVNDLRTRHQWQSSVLYALVVIVLPMVCAEGLHNIIGRTCPVLSWTGAVVMLAVVVEVVAVAVHELLAHFNDKSFEVLRKQSEVLQGKLSAVERVVPSAIHGILDSLKSELQLTTDERVSLYLVEDKGPELKYFCCERCSPNLAFEKKSCVMRPLIKMFKMIWDNGTHYDDRFPNCGQSNRAKKMYIRYCKENYGLSENEAEDIRFKGRAYYGVRIDYQGRHLAFLVVSSLKNRIAGKDRDAVEKIVAPSCHKLGAVIDALREYIPSPLMVPDGKEF